ncbi:MAG: electron transport complex subunit RsxA [Planctomycetes bacterium]|jgi:electron transport complex protein RnfA|nr:electron transport complex subunit RsxA [Planctomycetota bacterium]
MDIGQLLAIAVGAVFVNNFVLAKFLGLCPFLGVSKKTSDAIGMGLAVTFVMTLASFFTWLVFRYLLSPGEQNVLARLGLISPSTGLVDVLGTLSYILTIAALVQFVEMVMKKTAPGLFKALGIFLPLITTNCAVLGVTLLNTTNSPVKGGYDLVTALVNGFFSGVGFALVLLLMAGIRERLEIHRVPASLRGMPLGFICTALMALAFMGFVNMI